MGTEYTFYDYVDADGGGANVIKSWLNGDGKDSKAYFTRIIPLLEASPPPRNKDSVWGEPYTKLMKNKKEKWLGFIELRYRGNVQCRLLAQMIDRSVFLVACGIHKKPKYKTDVSPQTALSRVNQMISNPVKYTREHEYD